jgi:hypothetical protein
MLVNYAKTFFTGGTVIQLDWLFDLAPAALAQTAGFAAVRDTLARIPLAPYWLFVLGGLFIAVTLFLPRGLVGTLQHCRPKRHAGVKDGGPRPATSTLTPHPAE